LTTVLINKGLLWSCAESFRLRTPTAWQMADSSRWAISTTVGFAWIKLRLAQTLRFWCWPSRTVTVSLSISPPDFVTAIEDSVIIATYSPAGTQSETETAGATLVASKAFSAAMLFSPQERLEWIGDAVKRQVGRDAKAVFADVARCRVAGDDP